MNLHPLGNRNPLDTGVPCPECGKANLSIRFSCLSTAFRCDHCRQVYFLDQLVKLIDDAQFEAIEKRVGDRLSDRI